MATPTSKPSGPVSSPTTPTGEESVTTISPSSGLGLLSASTTTESDGKSEAVQRGQVEPPNKSPKGQTPASATRPKKYALKMWVEIDTGVGGHATPEEDSYSVDWSSNIIRKTYGD